MKNIEKMLDNCGLSYTKTNLKNSEGCLYYSKETVEDSDLKNLYNEACKEINKKVEKNIYRYYYYEKLEPNNPLHATIVMMNPAFADSKEADDTIKNIRKYLKNEKDGILKCLPNIHNNFGSFDIINLYPVRMPKSAKLVKFLKSTKSETEKYQKFVKNYLKENSKNCIVIAAWGSDKKDNELAQRLFKDLNIKFYCYGLTKDGYPKHFSSLAYNKFDKFRCPVPYIKINNWLKGCDLSEYDKERLTDVKNLKQWLTDSPSVSQDFVIYMFNLLEDVFVQV